MSRMPPHYNAPPAPCFPSTMLQSILANLCCLTVPRSIPDFRNFQGWTSSVANTALKLPLSLCLYQVSQHMLPHGTQLLPQHIPHLHGAAITGIMVHVTPESQGTKCLG